MRIGVFSKLEAVKQTTFLIFNLLAFAAFNAFKRGEGAEDVLEKINRISESYIEIHEETFAILAYILGGISLFGLRASFKQKTFSLLSAMSASIFAFVVLFFSKETGTTGGEIRHNEIILEVQVLTTNNINNNQDGD